MIDFTRFFRQLTGFLFIIFFFTICKVSGQTSQSPTDIFSPENRLKFGNFLFSDQDYLRAIDEYRVYLKFSNNDTVRFKFAYALAEIGRSKEALDNYKGLFFSSTLSEIARLEFYKVSFLNSESQDFRELCLMESYLPEEHKLEINRLRLFTHLLDDSYLPDSSEFINAFFEEERPEILSLYHKKIFPDYKNPTTAGLLSAIIPGAGKIYTGHYGDGITAFIAAGVLAYIAYDNYKAKNKVKTILFTGLAALTYVGNIYGSVSAAHQYNAGIQYDFKEEVKIYLNKKNYFVPNNDYFH